MGWIWSVREGEPSRRTPGFWLGQQDMVLCTQRGEQTANPPTPMPPGPHHVTLTSDCSTCACLAPEDCLWPPEPLVQEGHEGEPEQSLTSNC